MNGNGYDYYGDEYQAIAGEPPSFSTGGINPAAQPSSSGLLGTLQQVFDRFNSRPVYPSDSVSGQLYNAIYAFGAGKLDAAREGAARALLSSGTGSRFVQTVENERIKQLAPMFIIGAVVLFGIAFAIGKR